MNPRHGRSRASGPRQHLWNEAVLHLARLGREHLWRLTVGVGWIELRDETGWMQLHFPQDDQFVVAAGTVVTDQPLQQSVTANYAHALDVIERLARRE